jgi:glutamate synthase domain-containing protein 3
MHDKERLRNLIQNHYRYTNSPKAKTILDNFDTYLPKFIKVMPTEYKKVLIKMYAKNDQLKEVERGN